MHKKSILNLILLAIIIFSYFFVKDALSSGQIKIVEKPPKENAFEVKPAKVSLIIRSDFAPVKEYRVRLQNDNSLLELLEHLRQSGDLSYEKFAYTYGIELDNINGVKAPEGSGWRFLDLETKDFSNVNLLDGGVYELVLRKVN